MVTPIELMLTDVQALEYKGKCAGKVFDLTLIEPGQQMFGGRLRAQRYELTATNGK